MKNKIISWIKEQSKWSVLKLNLKKMAFILLGNLILAAGTAFFLIPGDIVTGGVSGIGIIVHKLTNFSVENTITILTWVCFVLGLVFLGKDFTFKTLISTITYPLFIYLMSFIQKNVDWLQLLTTSVSSEAKVTTDWGLMILSGLFGGIFVGTGCAITYIGGGSTGGVDVFTIMGEKYLNIKASIGSFIIDGSIVVIGLIVLKNFPAALIGIIAAFVCALAIDRVYLGQSRSYVAFIVSNKYELINQSIIEKMERGTTLIYSEGGYTSNKTKMIKVAFDRSEYSKLQTLISNIDTSAFVTIVQAHEVNGFGFKKFPGEARKTLIRKKTNLAKLSGNNKVNKELKEDGKKESDN